MPTRMHLLGGFKIHTPRLRRGYASNTATLTSMFSTKRPVVKIAPMKYISALTLLVMLAFAGNSLLVRLALSTDSIGPLSFSIIRLLAGALVLGLIAKPKLALQSGSWTSALYLLAYVFFFSYAYLSLDAGTGALILFATVQIVMIGSGLWHGERLTALQWAGMTAACLGLFFLLRPGAASSPNLTGAVLMGLAGAGWALYSLRGRHVESPALATAGNFAKASAYIVGISVPLLGVLPEESPSTKGILLALISGAITSGLGYTLWYKVLPHLRATRASIAQLSVPAIAAIGGMIFLNEMVTTRLVITTALVLGGVALATLWPDMQPENTASDTPHEPN